LAPHVGRLVKVFKYAAPLVAPGLGWLTPDVAKLISADVKLMTALVKKLPDIEAEPDLKGESGLEASEKTRAGSPRRSLRKVTGCGSAKNTASRTCGDRRGPDAGQSSTVGFDKRAER